MLGAPVTGSLDQWRNFSRVVSGRIVNGYCRGDWLLKFLYRTSTASIKIAGLDAIDWCDRRMINVDLSDIVNGHLDYYKKLGQVLQRVDIQVDPQQLIVPGDNKSLMRKCVSGMPDRSELRQLKLSSIRMSISDPSFARWFYPTSQHFNTRLPSDQDENVDRCKDGGRLNRVEFEDEFERPLRRAHSDESVLAKFARSSHRMSTSVTLPDLKDHVNIEPRISRTRADATLEAVEEATEALSDHLSLDEGETKRAANRSGAISVASSCSSSSGYGESVGQEAFGEQVPKSVITPLNVLQLDTKSMISSPQSNSL